MKDQDFYYFSICHVCKKSSSTLKKCSHCKLLYYCCRGHQMLDWPKHKTICKVITNTSKFRDIPPDCSPSDFNHFKFTYSLLWRYELGRELDYVEQQMWMFPKVCSICYSREAEIVCQTCLSVAYCSEEHRNEHKLSHKKYCASLKLCLVICQTLCSDEQLSVDWLYFKIDKEVQTFPENVEGMIKLMGFTNPSDHSKKHIDYIVMSEYFSPAINLIYALEKSGIVENRQSRKPKLTFHIVGCDRAENKMSWILILEYLSHWILNLKAAKVILVGPEAPEEDAVNITLKCDECRGKNFIGTLVKIKGLYHDHVAFLARPDLVVAFNSGLHEFADTKNDTWKKSIPKLINFKGVPTVLTAYTEHELKEDLARFKSSNYSYIVTPRRNPFSSLRPNRNWEEGGEPVFYQNGYVAIITKK